MKWPVLIRDRIFTSWQTVRSAATDAPSPTLTDSMLKLVALPPHKMRAGDRCAPKPFASNKNPCRFPDRSGLALGQLARLQDTGMVADRQQARGREADGHRGADAAGAVDGEARAMQLGEGLDQRQAEAGAAAMARLPHRALNLAERRQRPGDVFRRHADAVVLHRDGEPAVMGAARAHADPAAARREFDGIGQERLKTICFTRTSSPSSQGRSASMSAR